MQKKMLAILLCGILTVSIFGCAKINKPAPMKDIETEQSTESTTIKEEPTRSGGEQIEEKETQPTSNSAKAAIENKSHHTSGKQSSGQTTGVSETSPSEKPTYTTADKESSDKTENTTVPNFPPVKEESGIKKMTLDTKGPIPVLSILQQLGATVKWNKDKTVVTVSYDGKTSSFSDKDYVFEEITLNGEQTPVKDANFGNRLSGGRNTAIKIMSEVGATIEFGSNGKTCTIRLHGQKTGKLFVNGTAIATKSKIRFNCTSEELPLLAIMKALGADVQWNNAMTEVKINFEGLYSTTLNTKSADFGLLLPPGTEEGVRRVEGNEIIMDSDSIYMILNAIGATVNILDRDSLEISIIKK